MLKRALKIKRYLVAMENAGRVGGVTATEIAKAVGCSPPTIRNTLFKWGEFVGVQWYVEPYRMTGFKRLYYAVDGWTEEEV